MSKKAVPPDAVRLLRFKKVLDRFEKLKLGLMKESYSVWIEPDVELSHETKLVLRIDIYIPRDSHFSK